MVRLLLLNVALKDEYPRRNKKAMLKIHHKLAGPVTIVRLETKFVKSLF